MYACCIYDIPTCICIHMLYQGRPTYIVSPTYMVSPNERCMYVHMYVSIVYMYTYYACMYTYAYIPA